jgi:hypothetical protein
MFVIYFKEIRDYSALKNHLKKYSLKIISMGKGGAPFIKKQEEVIGIYILNMFLIYL